MRGGGGEVAERNITLPYIAIYLLRTGRVALWLILLFTTPYSMDGVNLIDSLYSTCFILDFHLKAHSPTT